MRGRALLQPCRKDGFVSRASAGEPIAAHAAGKARGEDARFRRAASPVRPAGSSFAAKVLTYILVGVALLVLVGCRSDMQEQPYYRPLTENDFYADKRSARPLVEGTVSREHLDADTYFYTGKIGNNDGDYLPFPVTTAVLARGQQRFNIYCSPCHGEVGDGDGMVVQRGYKHPPSYHIDRLRKAPIGYFFDVMSNGFGAMPDYREQVPAADRWAIASYIRALQLSQNARPEDVPAGAQIADAPPPGVTIMPRYDTQGSTTAASTPPKPVVPALGSEPKP
jgi:mono/diheme cytochrome c family protein